jgi:hypothetical protein
MKKKFTRTEFPLATAVSIKSNKGLVKSVLKKYLLMG